ncbi:DUF4920 domain-containing protein [Psychroflexus sp. ALD_RP9]|uniref:DUF4920 domain-containing protein n=1 Tax=Psychroflexus sp. ALD_RP9 TaxID=2777186 RepID=UPI001A8DF5D6|nr:DUF4920 domain-containing protein [Psychroflexus sp. ALD_RP9]QSS96416.1 DUF4920 domain-containing protein [Psychroflexus sp. ALD_RP9]
MKKAVLLSILLGLAACQQNSSSSAENEKKATEIEASTEKEGKDSVEESSQEEESTKELSLQDQTIFGEDFELTDVKSSTEIFELYNNLNTGDTLQVKFEAKVNSVCKKKGCWMRLAIGEQEEAFVKFKDYAFFVPKNSAGETAVVNGKAYVENVSVEEQRHMAEDAGKSEEEIAAITEPKSTLAFMASGVKYQMK